METAKKTSCQDSGSVWCHCSTDLAGGGGAEDFLGLFGDRQSSDDLFELVWRGSAGGGGGGMAGQPSCTCNCNPLSLSRPAAVAVVPVPETLVPPPPAPPSEAEMASWLLPIVSGGGEDSAGGHDAAAVVADRRRAWPVDDDQMVPSASAKESSWAKHHKLQEKIRKTLSSMGSRRRSHHHAEAHSLIEKRRRCKIKEKLKTLQQLVPGCDDNSNQASTLDQTIRYMKSLQQQIQAMSSFRCGMKPTSVAVYAFVQQAPSLACWWQGGTSVQGGWQRGEMALKLERANANICGHPWID